MSEFMNIFCPACDTEVDAVLRTQSATLLVRGEHIPYEETLAICPLCGEAIGDARVEGKNLERAYAVYRAKHNIFSPSEIQALRSEYGLSLREFSKFLGFGEQTVYRYEHGDIPDVAHNNTLLSSRTADGARLLLTQNGGRLSSVSVSRIEQRIQSMERDEETSAWLGALLPLDEKLSASNGYRRLDFDRVAALVFTLASKCKALYWTKLQKALFFADMLSYERTGTSLTGLTYAHATFGPVMDRKDVIRYMLAKSGVVAFCEDGWGEVLVPGHCDVRPFDDDELALIDEIADFVNTFNTASELSDYSHRLTCWSESADGQIIEYRREQNLLSLER